MKKLLIAVAVLAVVALVPVVGLAFFVPPRVAGDIATFLSDRTGHDVAVGSLRWSFSPRLHLEGEQIRVGSPSSGAAPLIEVVAFSLDAGLRDLLATPRRIRSVQLEGLRVHVPRGRPRPSAATGGEQALRRAEGAGPDVRRALLSQDGRTRPAPAPAPATTPIVVDRVVADEAHVEIASSRPDRPPQVYEIQALTLGSVALDRPMTFEASLTNPRPPGQVATAGTFGPWNKAEVRETPISGDYDFRQADLGTFKGIAGILASTGRFEGSLGRLHVSGVADIPDFSVTVGQVVPLRTTFEVEIGDRGGDVQLQPVNARFLESELHAVGAVVRADGGRAIVVDVTGENARVEDLIRFGLKSDEPPLTGAIDLHTQLEIPPGDRPVVERMRVAGEFLIRQARFSNLDVQKTLAGISRIGSGTTEGESGSSVVSDLRGTFEMADAEIRFSRLTFGVPGMQVRLAGTYGLRDEALGFTGQVHFERPISELVPSDRLPGRASRWLALIDPLFQRDTTSGTDLPITISGTRKKPAFRLELKKLRPDWRKMLERLADTR